ncbi:MAG: hypothetical protein SEPTF4163_000617 [Sporothrix epigloea]
MEQPIETEDNHAHMPSEASGSLSLPALPSRRFVILAPPESESSASDDGGVDEKDIRVLFSDPTASPFLDTVRRWQDNMSATDEPGYISLHDDSDESDFPHSASSRFLSSSRISAGKKQPVDTGSPSLSRAESSTSRARVNETIKSARPRIVTPAITLQSDNDEESTSGAALKASQRLFTTEKTKEFMRLILQCKQLGMLNSTKKKLHKDAWDKVASEMNSQYSTTRYTPSNIETKYDTERKRYRTWKALYEMSGVGVNYETGVLETSDEKWQDFVAKFGGSNPRNIQWLITTPLGDRDVYETVFLREVALGKTISGADDLLQGSPFGETHSIADEDPVS